MAYTHPGVTSSQIWEVTVVSIIRLVFAISVLSLSLGASGHQPSANFLDEIKDLKNQKFPSYALLDFISAKDKHFNNIGFALCMAAEREHYECDDAQGSPNLAFGICMASGSEHYECDDVIGKAGIGFALCMAGDREHYECDDAIGSENLSFGLCMVSGAEHYECDDMLE